MASTIRNGYSQVSGLFLKASTTGSSFLHKSDTMDFENDLPQSSSVMFSIFLVETPLMTIGAGMGLGVIGGGYTNVGLGELSIGEGYPGYGTRIPAGIDGGSWCGRCAGEVTDGSDTFVEDALGGRGAEPSFAD